MSLSLTKSVENFCLVCYSRTDCGESRLILSTLSISYFTVINSIFLRAKTSTQFGEIIERVLFKFFSQARELVPLE